MTPEMMPVVPNEVTAATFARRREAAYANPSSANMRSAAPTIAPPEPSGSLTGSRRANRDQEHDEEQGPEPHVLDGGALRDRPGRARDKDRRRGPLQAPPHRRAGYGLTPWSAAASGVTPSHSPTGAKRRSSARWLSRSR